MIYSSDLCLSFNFGHRIIFSDIFNIKLFLNNNCNSNKYVIKWSEKR